MAEGATDAKRRKTEEIDPVFRSFLTKNDKKYQLEQALLNLNRGISVNLATLRIDDCNARSSERFSKATVKVNPIKWIEDGDGIKGSPVGDIFVDGLDVLKNYLDKTSPKVPTDVLMQKALLRLLKFLSEKDHPVLFEEKSSGAQWPVTVAQHLLSKLAVNSTYTVSACPDTMWQDETVCPCKEGDQLAGTIGDTSYGCKEGWHGSSDILMEDLPVLVIHNEDEDQSVSTTDDEDFMQKDLHQLIAQTIVFSFLQRKMNRGNFKNSLVPGIGIAGSRMVFYFYDSENDVLLASKPMELFEGNTFMTSPVLFLWLTLNYRIFGTGLTDKMKTYKAEFFKRVDERLEMYTHNVERPVHIPQISEESLFPWTQETREPENVNSSHIEYTSFDT
ncbi:uncharacterized protein LOC123559033 [Mercenaria mercenaria]|uniref:uncharacterized protein LOC123559033 n=1 Tax=Mercenaria mercenaria TaxID=6596 RepID=UPI00234F7176|nr:uncharacterized protein LOC123559033 [Mercenaria mercenaria]